MHFKHLLFLLLCSLSMTAVADDYKIYSDNISATKGTNTSALNVYMTNEETISALQFDITFPVGVDVYYGENEDEDMVYFITKGERAKTDHTASYNRLADRKYRVMVSSPTNATFKETAANKTKPIAVITLDVAAGAQCGIKDVEISNVVLSHYDADTRVTQPYYPDNTASTIAVKPVSGAESSESDGILYIATAVGSMLDAATYNTLTSGKSDVVIDLRASEIADDISASDIQSTGASLYYLPSESEIEGENIIVDGVCSLLNLQDGKPFVLPAPFAAAQAFYTRPISYEYGTICLPFALESNASVQFYKLTTVSETTMTFEAVDELEAGEPALFKSLNGNNLSVDVANATVMLGEREKVQDASDWKIVGTYEEVSVSDADYIIANNKFWNAGQLSATNSGAEVRVAPFRAYFHNTSSRAEARSLAISVDEDATAINAINTITEEVQEIYDLNGRKVSCLQNGVSIVKFNNGKTQKVIIK